MKSRVVIFIGIVLSCAYGCRKEIPFTAEVTTSKLVVNSLFASDSLWSVEVSKSLSVIDQGTLDNIENATVVISTGSGTPVETLTHISAGKYVGTQMPQVGETYRVDVSAPNYASVYGEDAVPEIVNAYALDTVTKTISGEDHLVAQLTFDDPAGVKNYYRFSIEIGYWEYWSGSFGLDSMYFEEQVWIQLNDPSFEGGGSNSWSDAGIMSDLLFDGQTKTVELPITEWFLSLEDIRIEHIDVYFSNVSQTTHYFNRSYQLYQETQGNPFAQPVQVYSNITNGFGVFGGSQSEVYRIN
jgi:hypothetical protein